MKKISIGTWAYSIGPYADCPVPFDEIMAKLANPVRISLFMSASLDCFSPGMN